MTKKIIAIVNQKGGVGKTTSAINIASSLAKMRKKVLVVDLDPQANATTGSGIDKNTIQSSIYDVLLNSQLYPDSIHVLPNTGYSIIPANRNLAGAEIELVDVVQREYCLKEALVAIIPQYDLILLDCPPSLSLLTINGLSFANHVVVPMQCEYYALEGLTDLLNTISRIRANFNADLNLLGLVRTMYDKRSNLANQVSEELFKHFKEKVFNTYIPRNVRLAEAPSFGVSAIMLDANAAGVVAYRNLSKELMVRLSALD